jgi:hypothetical protein
MKRNTLLLAIAIIAAVGIAVGLFLSGAGQTDPLQGTLAPKSTTLTLGWTDLLEWGLGDYWFRLNGRLIDSTGAPVANRTISIRFTVPGETPTPTPAWMTPTPTTGVAVIIVHEAGTATTGADGSYSLQYYQPTAYFGKHPVYFARFNGDGTYLASNSPSVAGP